MKIARLVVILLFVLCTFAQPATVVPEARNFFAREHEVYFEAASIIPAAISGVGLLSLVIGHYFYQKSPRYRNFRQEIAERIIEGEQRRADAKIREEQEAKEREQKEKELAQKIKDEAAAKRKQDIDDAAAKRIREREEKAAQEKKRKADAAANEAQRLQEERDELFSSVINLTKTVDHAQCPNCNKKDLDLFSVHIADKSHQYCFACIHTLKECPEAGCDKHFEQPANLVRLSSEIAEYNKKIAEYKRVAQAWREQAYPPC